VKRIREVDTGTGKPVAENGAGSDGGEGHTEGVKTLLGDPRKAIIKLSIPMILAMSVQSIYNLADAIWVSGLGTEALSAVGFFFPFFMMFISVGVGLGIGGGAAISQRIGARDRKGADSVAVHTMVMVLILSVAFTVCMIPLAERMFSAMGATGSLSMAVSYGQVMFLGITFLFYSNVANALLRAEGDAKRAMYAMLAGGVLNIVLDPVFIYTLDMGVAGAAWATVISLLLVSAVLTKWLFFDRDTYISLVFSNFRFVGRDLRDIFKVGLPAMVSQMSMAIMMFFMTIIIVKAGGEDGVAVFTTGWRIITMGILPLLGMGTAVVSVCGASFGEKAYDKMDIAYTYAIRTGFAVEMALVPLVFFFAPWIVRVFTWSGDTDRIADDIVIFLRIACFILPATSLGMLSGAMFQGAGRGMEALLITLLRTIILAFPLAWVFGIAMDWGLVGVWAGLVIAFVMASLLALAWGKWFIHSLMQDSQSTASKKCHP